MKTCDEMVNSLLERRKQYVAAQKKRNRILSGAAVSLCVVALVGVILWKLPSATEQLPVTMGDTTSATSNTTATPAPVITTTDGGIVIPTTTATSASAPSQTEPTVTQTRPTVTHTIPTTLPTIIPTQSKPQPTTTPTVPQKIVITADEPDTYDLGLSEMPLKEYPRISPALQEKMKAYSGVDVLYSVIVEVLVTNEQGELINNLPYNNAELLQLAEEREIAYQEFIDAKEQYGWTEDVLNKQSVFKDIARQYSKRLEELKNEYFSLFIDEQLNAFHEWSNQTPIPLSTDTKFYPLFALDPNHAFFMELTADEIYELAKHEGYRIRLVFPGGDGEIVVPDMPE